MKEAMIKPKKFTTKECLKIIDQDIKTKVYKVKVKIPNNLPDIRYTLKKEVNKKLEPTDSGVASFWPRFWDGNGELEIGFALRIDNNETWFITSVLREIIDNKDHVVFKTSSGSTYVLKPQALDKDEFLKLRGIK